MMPVCTGPGARHYGVPSGGGSAFTDGQLFTMAGSSFGTNANVVQAFNGGIAGPIESAANGTDIVSGVTLNSGFAIAGGDPQFISTARALNGTKSILNRVGYTVATGGSFTDPGSGGKSIYGIRFDPGAPFLRAVSIVASYKTGFTNGQIKFIRFAGKLTNINGSNSDGLTDDSAPDILFNCYHGGIGAKAQWWDNTVAGSTVGSSSRFEEELPNTDLGVDPTWIDDGWVQQSYDFTPGTIETADGAINWRMVDATNVSTVVVASSTSGRRFWRTGDSGHRWWLQQFYLANTAQVDGAQINIDRDAYAVFNTASNAFPKFIYAGNASTYTACTKLVVQKFATWADTSITGTFNRGQLGGLTPGSDFWMYAMSGINTAINSSGVVPT